MKTAAAATAKMTEALPRARARLAAGYWEPALLVEQLLWIGVLAAVAMVAFGAGERRLQVVGG